MAVERDQFRIIPDPADPKKWAYELLHHDKKVAPVGGFKSAKEARRACDRALKKQA